MKTAPFCRWGTKTVPLVEPNYAQPNSPPRGAVSAPFFLSVYYLQVFETKSVMFILRRKAKASAKSTFLRPPCYMLANFCTLKKESLN